MCHSIVFPPTVIIGFGIRFASSPTRTPRPPQKITTFTVHPSPCTSASGGEHAD